MKKHKSGFIRYLFTVSKITNINKNVSNIKTILPNCLGLGPRLYTTSEFPGSTSNSAESASPSACQKVFKVTLENKNSARLVGKRFHEYVVLVFTLNGYFGRSLVSERSPNLRPLCKTSFTLKIKCILTSSRMPLHG